PFANLEVRDALLGDAADRLLAGDDRKLFLRLLDLAFAFTTGGGELADAHRNHNLLKARHSQAILVSKALRESRDNLLAIGRDQSGRRCGLLRLTAVNLLSFGRLLGLLFLLRAL